MMLLVLIMGIENETPEAIKKPAKCGQCCKGLEVENIKSLKHYSNFMNQVVYKFLDRIPFIWDNCNASSYLVKLLFA